MKTDNVLTARVARELMTAPLTSPTGHHEGLAAALITMGESVALQAYDDPAQGAGKNIGMGYNLQANAKTVRSDLKRALVPEERIDQVLAGEVQLTPEQAKRLLMVAMPRYEKQVQEVAEATSPGLWARMKPVQKAVMVDVAWQVGSTEKFKKAWEAVAANDMEKFTEETKVTYVDRSGTRREDKRRNDLRASMLAGIPHWEALVDKYESLPANKLAALK
jgi:GH24 family phage-related lysozyme (muramidase)